MNRLFCASFAAVLALPLLSGCYVEARTVPAEGELTYESEPPAPPPPEVEAVPPPPSPDVVWIAGYHRWDGRRYVWVRGRYERRPHATARWVRPHWEVRGRAHVWVGGRWE